MFIAAGDDAYISRIYAAHLNSIGKKPYIEHPILKNTSVSIVMTHEHKSIDRNTLCESFVFLGNERFNVFIVFTVAPIGINKNSGKATYRVINSAAELSPNARSIRDRTTVVMGVITIIPI